MPPPPGGQAALCVRAACGGAIGRTREGALLPASSPCDPARRFPSFPARAHLDRETLVLRLVLVDALAQVGDGERELHALVVGGHGDLLGEVALEDGGVVANRLDEHHAARRQLLCQRVGHRAPTLHRAVGGVEDGGAVGTPGRRRLAHVCVLFGDIGTRERRPRLRGRRLGAARARRLK